MKGIFLKKRWKRYSFFPSLPEVFHEFLLLDRGKKRIVHCIEPLYCQVISVWDLQYLYGDRHSIVGEKLQAKIFDSSI